MLASANAGPLDSRNVGHCITIAFFIAMVKQIVSQLLHYTRNKLGRNY